MVLQRVRIWLSDFHFNYILVLQLCPTLCSSINYTVHEILQGRILEWVAFPFSRGSSQSRDQTQVSHIAGRFFTSWAAKARTSNFTICMEIQKTSNSQSNLEKEEVNWRNQPAWLQALLQSHSHQDSMVLAQRQTYRSMEQNRKPRDKSTHLWTPYLWQRRQEYTMEKRQCL